MSPLVRHTLSAALALSFNLLPSANAEVITANFTFSDGGTATATGAITFDTTTYVNNGNKLFFGDVAGLTLTVAGATTGNGTFTKANFGDIYFNSTAAFDWNLPSLIGQNGWGPGGTGQFSFLGLASAPTASGAYEMTTNGGLGSSMQLISMAPPAPVPEPETYMLLGIASAALAYSRRRSKKQPQGTAEAQPSSLLAT